jgi:aspartate aminotransferase
MRPLSRRMAGVAPSQTTAFTTLVAAERRKGRRIIDLAVGEFTGPAPAPVISATRAALDAGHYRYGPVAGLPELRERLAQRHPGHAREHVIVSNGAKQALFIVIQALCDPGAEVIIPSPCWVSFPQMVRLAGGRPVLVPCRPDHQLDVDAVRDAVTEKTCAVLINSPNNPTGAVYPPTAISALSELAHRRGFYLISDETYADLVYDETAHSSVSPVPDEEGRLILISSFSKSYAMTGFRVGYTVAPTPIIAAMSVVQSHLSGERVHLRPAWGAGRVGKRRGAPSTVARRPGRQPTGGPGRHRRRFALHTAPGGVLPVS